MNRLITGADENCTRASPAENTSDVARTDAAAVSALAGPPVTSLTTNSSSWSVPRDVTNRRTHPLLAVGSAPCWSYAPSPQGT
eukprot:CAMPEP_0206225348 /NCGR_PEP_ID=MMETSP0047_2-20121206/7500_1 /ASSEMBLY_ACC=CAM_ASM_000192 /TAXON_ID=195065 /ORGANISM="Chroomonas mesostigmatica_cf, Strain CCMP1168" /LENGTH=82 /DNA_ID=CAMNT_0053648343 /DNA_START=213 /DNA_END=461 /DNA_ORIENTATION=-